MYLWSYTASPFDVEMTVMPFRGAAAQDDVIRQHLDHLAFMEVLITIIALFFEIYAFV